MLNRSRTVVAAVAVGGLLSVGAIAGCTPTSPASLSCLAVADPAGPLPNTNETVTVQASAAGATVVSVAALTTGSVTKTAVTNAHGAAKTVFNVGTSTPGHAVSVVTTVSKGSAHTTCNLSFTPAAAPTHQPANTFLQCPEIVFQAGSNPIPAHAYLIQTTQVNCAEADLLAAHSRVSGQGGGSLPFQLDGFICGLSGGFPNGNRFTCQNGSDLITFEYGGYPGQAFCPALTSPTIGDVTETGTDCDTTVHDVIAAGHSAPQSYSSAGFSCEAAAYYVPPAYTVYYVCTNSSTSAVIGFLEKGNPLSSTP